MKRICSLLALSLLALSCLAQTPAPGRPNIIDPESKAPFPYNHFLSCGIQDRSGNLWFGSSDGVYRYDGKLFTNYQVMDGLEVGHVTTMLQDMAGNIWFAASGGVVRLNTAASPASAPSFTSIRIQAASAFSLASNINTGNRVTQIIEDRNGAIWFAAGYNIYRTDGSSGTAITTAVGSFLMSEKARYHCIYPDDFGICGLYQDKQGNILFSTISCSCGPNVTYRLNSTNINDLCVLNKCTHDLNNPRDLAAHNKEIAAAFSKMATENGKTNIAFTSVLQDKAGNVWIGSDSGVYKYDGTHFTTFTKNNDLSKSTITTIYEDRSGNIWFGTGAIGDFQGNGAFRYNPGTQSIKHFTTKDGLCSDHPFSNNVISSITEDNAGKIWFGGNAGICSYDPASKAFRNFTQKDGIADDHIAFILKDKTGNLWAGTWNLGLYRYNGTSFTCFTENKPGI